jgi:hypothetical protein
VPFFGFPLVLYSFEKHHFCRSSGALLPVQGFGISDSAVTAGAIGFNRLTEATASPCKPAAGVGAGYHAGLWSLFEHGRCASIYRSIMRPSRQ